MRQSKHSIHVILALAFSVQTSSAWAGIHVVSDIDDTIKITSVRDPVSSVWNTFIEPKAFAGMPELFQALSRLPDYRAIDYVTAEPDFLQNKVERFLAKKKFPLGPVHLRGNESKETYKMRVIRDLLKQYPEDTFLLFGDDQEFDPTVYFTLYLENPGRIREIYIRSVRQARLPSAVYTFVTAFDVARMEFEFLRMDLEKVESVASAVLGESRDRRVLPQFQACPPPAVVQTENERVIELQKQVDSRINAICKRRGLLN